MYIYSAKFIINNVQIYYDANELCLTLKKKSLQFFE